MTRRVLIIGGGFAGLNAAFALKGAPAEVTLVDRRNFHLFQPLLYQVATGGLSPADISSPIRALLNKHCNCRVVLGEVVSIDTAGRSVSLMDGERLSYDTLVVAAGSLTHYYGKDEWMSVAPGLKTIEDAVQIRARVLGAFEAAERTAEHGRRQPWLTFVVVGGGPTGVELAGAIGELALSTLRHDFRSFSPSEVRVYLFEGGGTILPAFGKPRRQAAQRALERLGVTVCVGSKVSAVDATGLTIQESGSERRVLARTVLWAAGVRGSGLVSQIVDEVGAAEVASGRIVVGPDFTVPGHQEIFVIGDLASHSHQGGEPLPATADVAIAEGKYVGRLIRLELAGRRRPQFSFRSQGRLAVIGRSFAVAELGPVRLTGWLAWMSWLFIHLLKLVEYENRVLVAIQWGWSYVTRNRSARLITSLCPCGMPTDPDRAPGSGCHCNR